MDKLKLIIKREFLAKVRNKSFIIMTILSPLLMVGIGMLIIFLSQKNREEVRTIAFVDESELLTDAFRNSSNTKYVDLTELGLEEAKTKSNEFYYGLIYIPKNEDIFKLSDGISFYSENSPNLSLLSNIESRLERRIRNLKLKELNFDLEKLNSANTDVDFSTENFVGEKSSKTGSILKMATGGAFGYLIFMFIIIYGTSVMRSVIEEKTSRIIEIIVSSVKPFYLMLGKIFGNALAGILQFTIWIISAGTLFYVISLIFGIDPSSSSTTMTPEMMDQIQNSANGDLQMVFMEIKSLPILTIFFSFIVYFLGGYLIYSSIYAAIGAAVDSETDTQQFMMPVLMPLMIAIYVGFSVIENPHGSIAVGFSLFPLTSPIVMLMRIPFGVPWWQLLVSMFLLIITFIGIVWFAAKIYRVGILMYGKKPTYKELYKWLKY